MNAEQEGSSPFFARAPFFRDIWAASVSPAKSPRTAQGNKRHPQQMPLGWALGSVAIILILVVSLMAWMAIRRSESAMAELLSEKGSSLIMAFESALRTGMNSESGLRLQALLEEMTRSPDMEFVAVTMPNGVIVAHSERDRIGEILHLQGREINAARIAQLAPTATPKWRIIRMEGRRVFLVYRHFMLGNRPEGSGLPEPTIFLGLDVDPFEITNSQNRSYIAALGFVMLLVGMVCLVALNFAQRAAESRRRQHRAEGEVHRLEEEMRRSERMAAIGTLAAGVAHEIRNPLSSIKGYATYFGQRFPEGSDDREAANVMVSEVNRLNRVITDLLGLSRPSDVRQKPICLENIVAHVIKLIHQYAASRNVRIVSKTAPRVPDIMADMERLSQALLNLCLNALDAMPDGGTLTIAVAGGRKQVCLIVRDTGEGISPENMAHIFDPYFTTKSSGTGLGLPMVHKIVQAHGGEMEVVSHLAKEGGHGETIFRIWLPVAGVEKQ